MVRKAFLPLLIVLIAIAISACGSSSTPSNLTEQEALGQRLFSQNCAACHAQSGDAIIVGPSLAGIGARAADKVPGEDAHAYIKESILDPDAYLNEGFDNLMPPTFGDTLDDEEIEALISYLMLLE